jgi:L-fuculokinase
MSTATERLIAVFDVGKTNAKISVVDPAQGRELWSARRPNDPAGGPGLRELDVHAIEAWLIESLRQAPERERIGVIVPVAHGAAAVLVDHAGEIVAAPDYEDTCFNEVAEEYASLRDAYSMTFSPNLPQGLNLGRQLYYLQARQPALFQRAANILLYPQFWAWRMCGVMTAEVTSLGNAWDASALRWPRPRASLPTARWPAASTIPMPPTCDSSWIASARHSPWSPAAPGP